MFLVPKGKTSQVTVISQQMKVNFICGPKEGDILFQENDRIEIDSQLEIHELI